MPAKESAKDCKCNWGYTIIALVLGAIGIFLIAGGFIAQFYGKTDYLAILGWYFVGLIVVFLAKMAKWKACGNCKTHAK
ncbi:MAG: hypothetical protein WC602_00775 [archaeon]